MRLATVSSLQMIVTLGKDSSSAPSSTPADPLLLNVLVPPLGEMLGVNPVGRLELLTWLNQHSEMIRGVLPPSPENIGADLTVPLINAMQDKTAAIRALAEQLLGTLMSRGVTSRAVLDKATRDLPPATKRSLQPSIDRLNGMYGVRKSTDTQTVVQTSIPAPAPTAAPAPVVKPVAAVRPAQVAVKPVEVPITAGSPKRNAGTIAEGSTSYILKKTLKSKRCDDFYKTHWPQPPNDVGEAEMTALKATWEPYVATELLDLFSILFPKISKSDILNQDSFLPSLAELVLQIDNSPFSLQHSDFILRYSAYVLCVRETASGLLKLLQFITYLFEKMKTEKLHLHEAEMLIIIPHLIERSGHKSERHKVYIMFIYNFDIQKYFNIIIF